MPSTINWIDRLRIERVVWELDQRLYDLPRRSRIARRREVRSNLLTASADVGTAHALSNLGSSRQLAADYLDAEFGDAPRPAWMAAAVFVLAAVTISTWLFNEAVLAFGDGVAARDPHATGIYTWHGIRYLQDTVTYTFTNGHGQSVGGALTPIAWAIGIIVTILVGRIWRAPAQWRRRRAQRNDAGSMTPQLG